MLSTSPANSSSPSTSTSTRPSRLRRLSNLRTALNSSESSPNRSSRPLFHRAGSTPEVASRNRLTRDTASPSPGPDSTRNTLSPTTTSTQPSTTTIEPERVVQIPLAVQPPPTTRRRSQTTSSIASNTAATSAAAPAAVEMTRSRTDQGSEAGPVLSPTSTRPTVTRKETSSLPSIRFVPASQDQRSSRPSLNFQTVTRTLPSPDSVIRVGRYSEKDAPPPEVASDKPSDAAVGFKSKVVSRRHCEFFWKDSSWWIKDVKSSSGTFLNHIRLSQPGQESKPWAIKDGDIVQLGIDFKGGEEAIFRCVKIRILCNRGWQKELNSFNTSAHKQLRKLANSGADASTIPVAGRESTECTICLSSIAPCQALFIAPCSHTWHFKCIKPVLMNEYPAFLCPNCRFVADLDEDIEEPEQWEQASADEEDELPAALTNGKGKEIATAAGESEMTEHVSSSRTPSRALQENGDMILEDDEQPDMEEEHDSMDDDNRSVGSAALLNDTANLTLHDSLATPSIPIPSRSFGGLEAEEVQTPMNDVGLHHIASHEEGRGVQIQMPSARGVSQGQDVDGPMTPRNTAGPFVFS